MDIQHSLNSSILVEQEIQERLNALNDLDLNNRSLIRALDIENMAQLGHLYYKKNHHAEALKFYKLAHKFDPDHISVLNQLGMCYIKLNKHQEARDYFQEMINRASSPQDTADAWLNIAYSYRLESNWRKADKALQESVNQLNGMDVSSHLEKLKHMESVF